MCRSMFVCLQNRCFVQQVTPGGTFNDTVVASALSYPVVCWGNVRKALDKLVQGPWSAVLEMRERKALIMNHTSQPRPSLLQSHTATPSVRGAALTQVLHSNGSPTFNTILSRHQPCADKWMSKRCVVYICILLCCHCCSFHSIEFVFFLLNQFSLFLLWFFSCCNNLIFTVWDQ